jgi:hypothetical protein
MIEIIKNLICLDRVGKGRNTPTINPKEYVQVRSYKQLINHRVEFYFFKLEFSDINRLGRVQISITISLAVEYFINISEVIVPIIIPRLIHELMIKGADYESI